MMTRLRIKVISANQNEHKQKTKASEVLIKCPAGNKVAL